MAPTPDLIALAVGSTAAWPYLGRRILCVQHGYQEGGDAHPKPEQHTAHNQHGHIHSPGCEACADQEQEAGHQQRDLRGKVSRLKWGCQGMARVCLKGWDAWSEGGSLLP